MTGGEHGLRTHDNGPEHSLLRDLARQPGEFTATVVGSAALVTLVVVAVRLAWVVVATSILRLR